MRTILIQAFRRTSQNWKIILLIFFVNFVLGLCLAFPSFNILQEESHNSLVFNNLVADFDFTIFYDFMNKGGKSLLKLFPISLFLSVIYILLSIFFAGGILSQFTIRDTFRLNNFFNNSAHYFLKFCLIALIQLVFILFALIISIVLFGIFGVLADGNTEPKFVMWMIPPFAFLAFIITFLLNVGDYARVLVHRDSLLNPWNAFWKAVAYVFKNFKTMQLYWSVLLAIAILLLLYLWVESTIEMESGFTIWLMFLIQQAYVFCRIFVRMCNLSNAFDYISLRPIPITEKPAIIEHYAYEEAKNEDDTVQNKLSE